MAKTKTKSGTIVHPHYGCTVGAAYTVAAIKNAVPIANCGPGCMYKQFFLLSFDNGFQGSAGAGGGNVPSANVGENDIVFGGEKKLDDLIKSSLAVMNGDLFVVLTGCSGELIGDNVESVVSKYQKQGFPIVAAQTGGFKGTNLTGHEIVIEAIINQYVGDYDGEKEQGLVNLWFDVPYFHQNWRGDYLEIVRILKAAGLKVNILFGAQSGGAAEWKQIPKAQFNLVISPWIGLKTAKFLQRKYNQPFLHIPEIPIGEEATTAFIRKVVAFAGIDPAKSEAFIKEEAELYYYFLEHFAEFFSEYWFGLPSQFAVVGDSAYTLAYTKYLSSQIGMIPVRQIITDNPPEKYRDSIREQFLNLAEGVSIEPEFIEDGYIAEQKIRETDFGSGVPLILGTTWETDAVREKNGLLIEIGPPTTEEVTINKTYIGYRGAFTLLERIYSAAVGGK